MKKSNIDLERLKRTKNMTPEQRMEWLYSALCFAQTEKRIVTKKKRVVKK